MIPKISRGQKIGGLLVYLLGEGEHNEHRHRHVIAGSPTVMQAEWLRDFDGPQDKRASREVALAIAHELDLPRLLHGTQARMRAKVGAGVGGRGPGADVVEPAAKGEKGTMRNAPVWHCVLALNPGEELTDEKWAELANEFMMRMGFTGSADGKIAPARWAAVRHGRSGERGDGQEHIHIAASLIREDGSKVSTYDYGPGRKKGDRLRAQEVCNELEHQFGLKVLRSREEGGGHSGNSRAEIERAKRTGALETERERLRRVVRAAATGTDTETEFVHALREAGVSIRPRYAAGGRTHVEGYSVRWRRDGVEVGPWVGGGKLDNDLTLTALREQHWADSPQARADAVTAWLGAAVRSGARRDGAGLEDPQTWRAAAAEIGEWQRRLDAIPTSDRAQWAWAAGQASGVFAAFSEALEGDTPGPFAAAAKELARSAQVPYASQRYRPRAAGRGGLAGSTRTGLGAAAALLFEEATRPGGSRLRGAGDEASQVAAFIVAALLVLLLIAIAIAIRIAGAHRARWQISRAVDIDQSMRHLDPVRRAWEA
ncbi:relaxase/mobilization nuclease domain-containing protein, partial [Nocardia sp. CY41]|uniref:relaxase/mobilization nuclease domain-containing protein n=1 Tax=Nocardia sp. CY41 TaxID=2608686 RepID=UPI001357C273